MSARASDFDVEIDESGRVSVSGASGIYVLMDLVLQAKFGTEPDASTLLDPRIASLTDALAKVIAVRSPWLAAEWSDPARVTPGVFRRVAEVVRRRGIELGQAVEGHPQLAGVMPGINELLQRAMKPYVAEAPVSAPGNSPAMTEDTLDRLESLDLAASPAPWFIRHLDDEMCMSATAVSTRPDTGRGESMRSGEWPGSEVVAATCIQAPPYAVSADGRSDENAELIAECRTHLSELLRLARLGLRAEQQAHQD